MSSRPFISRCAALTVLACAVLGFIALFSFASSFYLLPVARVGLGLQPPAFSETQVRVISRSVMAWTAMQTLLYVLLPLYFTNGAAGGFVSPFLFLPAVASLCILCGAFRLGKLPPSAVDVRVLTRQVKWCAAAELATFLSFLGIFFFLTSSDSGSKSGYDWLFPFQQLLFLSPATSFANAVAADISDNAWRRYQGALLSPDESSYLGAKRSAELAFAGPGGAPAGGGGFAARGGEEGAPLFAAT